LSHWYEHTTGPGRSVSEALRWLKRAADYGHANAYYDLAYAHANGKLGTSPDPARELALIRKGADRGSVSARYRLGVCYLNGDGVGQDFVAALELLLDAAERGEKVAPDGSMEMVAYLYDRGARGIPANGTEAVRWLRRAAKRESGWALARLGAKYLYGEDVEQDSRKAFDLFRRSASAGEADGMAWLGYAYQHGYRTERNLAEARRWYQRAADKGSEWATKSLRALDGASKPGLLEQLGRALRRGTTTTTATGD
jgi:TPR repeat protein